MIIDENNVEKIIDILNSNNDIVDRLSDEQVDYLINYLSEKIKHQEKILDNLKNSVES